MPDARLLYFLHHAHGSGPSYQVVTITAIRDGAAWERLAQRVAGGDLAAWARELDELRHDVTREAAGAAPVVAAARGRSRRRAGGRRRARARPLFMEDTVWPFEGRLEEYVQRSGTHYAAEMARAGAGRPVLAARRGGLPYRPSGAIGAARSCSGRRWCSPGLLKALLTREVPPEYKRPGTWMHDALELRDRWQSKLLRTARWSPWH